MLHTQRGRVLLHPYECERVFVHSKYGRRFGDTCRALPSTVTPFRSLRGRSWFTPQGAFFRKLWAPLSTAPVRLGDASVTLLRLYLEAVTLFRNNASASDRPAHPNRHTPSRWGTSKVASFQQRRVISRPPRCRAGGGNFSSTAASRARQASYLSCSSRVSSA